MFAILPVREGGEDGKCGMARYLRPVPSGARIPSLRSRSFAAQLLEHLVLGCEVLYPTSTRSSEEPGNPQASAVGRIQA